MSWCPRTAAPVPFANVVDSKIAIALWTSPGRASSASWNGQVAAILRQRGIPFANVVDSKFAIAMWSSSHLAPHIRYTQVAARLHQGDSPYCRIHTLSLFPCYNIWFCGSCRFTSGRRSRFAYSPCCSPSENQTGCSKTAAKKGRVRSGSCDILWTKSKQQPNKPFL